MGIISNEIEQKLNTAFAPCKVSLLDQSRAHAGHAGAHPEGESHFSLTLISERFEAMSRLERARLVHEALGAELLSRIHALSMTLRSVSESIQLEGVK